MCCPQHTAGDHACECLREGSVRRADVIMRRLLRDGDGRRRCPVLRQVLHQRPDPLRLAAFGPRLQRGVCMRTRARACVCVKMTERCRNDWPGQMSVRPRTSSSSFSSSSSKGGETELGGCASLLLCDPRCSSAPPPPNTSAKSAALVAPRGVPPFILRPRPPPAPAPRLPSLGGAGTIFPRADILACATLPPPSLTHPQNSLFLVPLRRIVGP